jgi:ABC-type transport system substrate-binding protein
MFGDPSLERMALVLQQQMQSVGIGLGLDSVAGEVLLARLESGDFDCAVLDIISGPNLMRPYWFWHSQGPHNWGRFSSKNVDTALDTIRHAVNDDEYKAGVAALQLAIVEDPPAIFLAWSERARAVSTRFEVPVEPGRDILSTLRLWRPVSDRPN